MKKQGRQGRQRGQGGQGGKKQIPISPLSPLLSLISPLFLIYLVSSSCPMPNAQFSANIVTAISFISRVICNYPPIA